MKGNARTLANNDLVYLWWTYPEKIPDCLGFTIHRLVKGKEPEPLPTYITFKSGDKLPQEKKNTDYFPIQSYNWKDLYVPHGADVSYRIIPVKGIPYSRLDPINGLALETEPARATEEFGKYRVVFNAGIIATQALAKVLDKEKNAKKALENHINKPDDSIRKRLSGDAVPTITGFLDQAVKEGGTCYCAIYELTDRQLRDAIIRAKGHVEVILANADSTITNPEGKKTKDYDGTNRESRRILKAELGKDFYDYLMPKGNYIGHNKFVVATDRNGKPKSVLTGSTNWTPTGLCTQTNNIIVIHDQEVAARYMAYWQRLLADGGKTLAPLRTANAKEEPEKDFGGGEGSIRPWFSPNTRTKSKPRDNPPTPPDMDEIFTAIGKAKHGALFLLFNAGTPSIVEQINEKCREYKDKGKYFFVRGAISDSRTSEKFRTRVYNDSMLENPNTLITGVGGVPGDYAFWEKELAQMGHAVIHDKILVLDPFSEKCTVITGSHNLGFKASFSNTENLCIIRDNKAVAAAYTAHIMDVVNHFNWRNKVSEAEKAKKAGKEVKVIYPHLDMDDRWQDKYFRGDFQKSRDRFFFGSA